MTDIVVLGNAKDAVPERYGWKVARLHDLRRAGFAVMNGFALAAQEHLDHLDRNGLDPTATGAQVLRSALSDVLRQDLREAATGMGSLFAVRSSALIEDRASATQAGRYLSVLNVAPEDVGKAVLHVWASAHSEGPALCQKFSPMAVLIQPMLLGTAYGVVSSADPVTGTDVAMVEIGASPTSVTSGGGLSARYEVRPDMTVEPEADSSALISEAQLRAGAVLAWAIHERQGHPVELEVGWTPDRIVILQSRPLSTPPPSPLPTGAHPPGNWVLDPVHYPRPLTPLFESIFPPLVHKASASVFTDYGVFSQFIDLKTINGWPYVQAVPMTSATLPNLPGVVIGLAVRVHPRMRRRLRASARALSSDLPSAHVSRWQKIVAPAAMYFITETANVDLQAASASDLQALLGRALAQLELVILSNFQTDFAHLIPLARFVSRMRRRRGWTDAQSLSLVRGVPNANGAYPAALQGLASQLRENPDVVERLRSGPVKPLSWIAGDNRQVRNVWDRHRRRWELTLLGYDLDDPTLREIVEIERHALLAILDGAGHRSPQDEATRDLSPAERESLSSAQRWYHLREEGESVKAALLGVIRLIALEVGRRLAQSGAIPRADLALSFTIKEMSRACAAQMDVTVSEVLARAHARRAAMARVPEPELGERPVRDPDLHWLPRPSRIVHNAVTLLAQNEILAGVPAGTETLRGRGVSPGVHTGRVRIVSRPEQLLDVQTGEIIVASSASSTWSTGFWVAGALVTESGGLLSHSAIVAREMGLPAVVGVPAATTRLANGDIVTVDGGGGTVIHRESIGL